MTWRADRPEVAKPCATCGELLGRGYPTCPRCAEVVDRPLRAEDTPTPPATPRWTSVDWALRQQPCPTCGGELGAGAPDCVPCAAADASRWQVPALTSNEHALRTAIVVLRAWSWHREAVVSTWRLVLPFVLTGAVVPAPAMRDIRTQVLAGRYDELVALDSLPLALPLLPWRRSTVQRELDP